MQRRKKRNITLILKIIRIIRNLDKYTMRKDKTKNDYEKRLYSIKEAASYLGRSEWGVRELVWAGRIPFVKVGRRVHIDIHDLDNFIEQNKIIRSLLY